MRLFIVAAFLMILPFATAKAQGNFVEPDEMPAGEYILDKGHASITWRVNHLGLSMYTARFTDFDAQLDYNPENPEQSVVTVSINPMSIKTDYPFAEQKDFDKLLATGEDWFNAGEFATIEFKSTGIDLGEENTGTVTGDLSMLGVTKPLTLDVVFNGAYLEKPFANIPAFGFSAATKLSRSEWGMSTYVPNIGDEIEVIIEVEFHKMVAEN